MKTIALEYKEFAAEQANLEEKRQFYTAMDAKISQTLLNEGYSIEQIKEALLRQSPILRNQNKAFIDSYIQQIVPRPNTPKKSPSLPAGQAYRREKIRHAETIMQFCLHFDRNIACRLLDKGRTMKEVQKGILEKSLFCSEIQDAQLNQVYCDKVLDGINRERLQRLGNRFDLAQDVYLQKTATLQHKYDGYNGSNYNEFQEGNVVISMMMQAGIPAAVITEVLQKNSRNKTIQKDPGYVQRIIEQCEKVKQAYLAILNADPRQAHTPVNTYRLFAKKYMQSMHIEIINGKDEQKIVQRMFNKPFTREEIHQALQAASPVAIEPGRQPGKYITTVLTAVEESYAKSKAQAKENYQLTVALYEEKMQQKQHLFTQKKTQIDHNRSYYDGIIVRELLEMKQYIPHIIKTIVEKIPQTAIPQHNKTPEEYAKWLIAAAQKVIAAEKKILGYKGKLLPNQQDKGSYQMLLRLGYTAKDIYQAAIKERIQTYPSVALSLSADFIDKDACEKILTKYPDFSLDDLKYTIQDNSPRSQMPGISSEYPELVIREAEQRIEKTREQENQAKDIQREYLRQCGLANEGVEPEANMVAYHDGRAALRMIVKGIDRTEILNSIAAGAEPQQKDPDAYAKKIMQQVEKVKHRLEEVKTYSPTRPPQNASEEYQRRLAETYEQRKYISSSIDASIAADMMLLGIYKNAEIIAAIQAHSPAAIEPGRGERYGDFIEEKAKETVEQEHRKLKQYAPVPRLQKEASASQEYAHHVAEMQHCIHLPLTMAMDLMIAKTMIEQGYKENELTATFDQSVCAQQKKQYGKDIVRIAQKNLSQEKEQGLELGQGISMSQAYQTT